jgi:hypothetical protein
MRGYKVNGEFACSFSDYLKRTDNGTLMKSAFLERDPVEVANESLCISSGDHDV